MARRVVFLHTVPSLAGLFTDLSKELLPEDVEVIHIADELLLKRENTLCVLSVPHLGHLTSFSSS